MSRFDVLVVLGAPLARDGSLGAAVAERVEAGVAAWKAGVAPLILVTGVHEATAMKRRAVDAGVPPEAILVERAARTTRENALRSSELMRAHGLERAGIVTQAYHRPRSVAAFRRLGVDAEAIDFPSRPSTVRAQLREWVGRIVYKLRGWI